MGANAFDINGAGSGNIFASFSLNDMENGLPLTGAVGIANLGSSLFPTNLLGTQPGQMPPPGTPNYFVRNATTTTYQVRTFTPGPELWRWRHNERGHHGEPRFGTRA
jgi:hypothetical protein